MVDGLSLKRSTGSCIICIISLAKCNRLGCLSKAIGQGRCQDHGGIERSSKWVRSRGDHHKLYNNKKWATLRVHILHTYPLCLRCKYYGYLKEAVDVDHIQAHKGNVDLFYSISNLQTLCRSCHSWKTQRENEDYNPELDWRKGQD